MKEIKENWKDVKGYEGLYMVSDSGRVKSLRRKSFTGKQLKEKILKGGVNSSGYLTFGLSKNGKLKTFQAHQLVCVTFLNHAPNGYKGLVCDHKNNNRLDNRLVNLQLVTCRENLSKDRKNKTSKYTGVCWVKANSKWQSAIRINGKKKYLGSFNTELEAHKRYQLELSKL